MLLRFLLNSLVEGVETVETIISSKRIKEIRAKRVSTNHEKSPVESVEGNKPIFCFSTFSTNFNEHSVERFNNLNTQIVNELDYFPRVPRLPHKKTNNANKIKEPI